jgi:hypothetical protein
MISRRRERGAKFHLFPFASHQIDIKVFLSFLQYIPPLALGLRGVNGWVALDSGDLTTHLEHVFILSRIKNELVEGHSGGKIRKLLSDHFWCQSRFRSFMSPVFNSMNCHFPNLKDSAMPAGGMMSAQLSYLRSFWVALSHRPEYRQQCKLIFFN